MKRLRERLAGLVCPWLRAQAHQAGRVEVIERIGRLERHHEGWSCLARMRWDDWEATLARWGLDRWGHPTS